MKRIRISSIVILIVSAMVLTTSYFCELPTDLLITASFGTVVGIIGAIITVPSSRRIRKMRACHA